MNIAIECDDLPDPENGNIVFTPDNTAPFDLNTVAMYECFPGYVLAGEFEERTCMADHDLDTGFWDRAAPTCECELFLIKRACSS